MKKLSLFLFICLIFSHIAKADEGMWLLNLVGQLNMQKMQQMGLKLSAEDIYSTNKSSLKDAIVALDYGSCTGELVSAEGLLLTNHHCGYSEIQYHSTVEHDYLTNGFWAMTRDQELPNPGKTATFVVRIEDVTEAIISQLDPQMTEEARKAKIEQISGELANKAIEGTHYEARVRDFFDGNNFYLFVLETFKDVRLVGAPPSSIGKFGGDTDNWAWPRHTGDFSIFRVYCGPDGKPADYSPNNVPLKPRHFLPVSLKGVNNNDFTMVLGFPGSTQRYLTSWGVLNEMEVVNDTRIKVRTEKRLIMKEAMDSDEKIRIQYAVKFSSSNNYWKYSIEQNKSLKALNVVGQKQEFEKKLDQWIKAEPDRVKRYGEMLKSIEKLYGDLKPYDKVINYWGEAFWRSCEFLRTASRARELEEALQSQNPDDIKNVSEAIKKETKDIFKDYNAATDLKITTSLLKIFFIEIPEISHPSFYNDIEKQYKGDFEKFAQNIFKKSLFVNEEKLNKFLDQPALKTLQKDPGYIVMKSVLEVYFKAIGGSEKLNLNLSKELRLFINAIKEMDKDKSFYPDANSTLRFTYGSVCGYNPRDAVKYKYFTTLKGYIEKEDPSNEEFIVPEKLKTLYFNKDFGRYGKNDTLYTCFTSNNDITGGNSGSPVLNGNGELVGLAFDGNWEAMSGDIAFEPNLQRCINVDIRFVLWVIDKFAGASHLINEMKVIEY